MYRRFFKRFFDIIGALLLLPFLVLEIMILGPFIWFTDRGPVFYNARRAGKGYKPFKMFKFGKETTKQGIRISSIIKSKIWISSTNVYY